MPDALDNYGIQISVNGLPHMAEYRAVQARLHPCGILGLLRREVWWRLFPAELRELREEVVVLTILVQMEVLDAVIESCDA